MLGGSVVLGGRVKKIIRHRVVDFARKDEVVP